jgi:transcriptional regulator
VYTKEQFSLPSIGEMRDFVRSRSFGVLATCHAGAVHTSPLPLDLRGDDDTGLFVAGHVARANDMSKVFVEGPPATITVLGPDTYIPAEWFGTRSRIPTWLYCAVEISGRLELSDAVRTREDVIVFIERLQKDTVEDSSWTLDEIRADLTEQYLKGIVGYRMYDLRFKSCFRLNQRKGESEHLAASLTATDVPACQHLAPMVLQPPTVRVE